MDNQNIQQPVRAKFCKKCGSPLPPEVNFCLNCGAPVTTYVSPAPVIEQPAPVVEQPAPVVEQPSPVVEQPAPVYQPDAVPPMPAYQSIEQPTPPPKKSKKKVVIPIVIILVIISIAATLFALIYTHTICINHEWRDANCIKPKICRHCNKTEGEALGHSWSEGSCTEDKTCLDCGKFGEKAPGHTEGNWAVVKEATLTETGTEESSCAVCSEPMNTRVTEKKKAMVVGSSFNFGDKEFIEWMNEHITGKISTVETEFSEPENGITAYQIVNSDGNYGMLFFNHDEGGNINGILIYFEDWITSAALGTIFGQKIDSEFASTEDEENTLFTYISNDVPYSDAGMTITHSMSDDLEVVMLVPSASSSETV